MRRREVPRLAHLVLLDRSSFPSEGDDVGEVGAFDDQIGKNQ